MKNLTKAWHAANLFEREEFLWDIGLPKVHAYILQRLLPILVPSFCVKVWGPLARAGCGKYIVGEIVKLLKELNAFYEYDIILFDVLGDTNKKARAGVNFNLFQSIRPCKTTVISIDYLIIQNKSNFLADFQFPSAKAE